MTRLEDRLRERQNQIDQEKIESAQKQYPVNIKRINELVPSTLRELEKLDGAYRESGWMMADDGKQVAYWLVHPDYSTVNLMFTSRGECYREYYQDSRSIRKRIFKPEIDPLRPYSDEAYHNTNMTLILLDRLNEDICCYKATHKHRTFFK